VDGETPMYAGEYAARETDTGANLYQKICMAIAQRWPEISLALQRQRNPQLNWGSVKILIVYVRKPPVIK